MTRQKIEASMALGYMGTAMVVVGTPLIWSGVLWPPVALSGAVLAFIGGVVATITSLVKDQRVRFLYLFPVLVATAFAIAVVVFLQTFKFGF